jgi:hypothetical protein
MDGCVLMCCGIDVMLDGGRILIPSLSLHLSQQHAVISTHLAN